MLLLSDGTVFAASADSGSNWYRLTPDSTGSYINGTWTTVAAMHDTRLYYASDVLTNGMVFVAGSEYYTGGGSGEIYDPVLNTWTMCTASGGINYDMISVILTNGNVLTSPVFPAQKGHSYIFNPVTDSWPLDPALVRGIDEDEASWVKLPDSSILTIDPYGDFTERFIESLNEWFNDTQTPVTLYDPYGDELGPAFLLPNGNAIFIGSAPYYGIYTPTGTTLPGTWTNGNMPVNGSSLGAPDAPAAMMVTGNILCALSPTPTSTGNVFTSPTYFYEYNYSSGTLGTFTQEGAPGGGSSVNEATYIDRMLDLPDGTVLFSESGKSLYVYQPGGTPLASGQPAITSITTNYYRSYQLTGTLLNGISQGAAYGDDAQMDSNYPLVRMTNNSTGAVYYARTYNWSGTSVMTGSAPVTTEFIVPPSLPAGTYSLVVVANGNSSAPVSFTFAPDSLALSTLAGFAASAPTNGGPVVAVSTNIILTNTSGSTIQWSAGNAPAWLTISTTNGTINSGATQTVTVSLNFAAATAQPAGNYAATLWFTNLTTGAIQSVPFSYQSTPLVLNGGFEYGSTAFWTFSGSTGSSQTACTGYETGTSSYVHSGAYSVALGKNTSLGSISQTIPTVAGQLYALSFWLNNSATASTNEFVVSWNGTNLYSQNTLGAFSFTNFQFSVAATGPNTVLKFSFINSGSFFGLDDVSLVSEETPTIVTPPASVTVAQGSNATFSVTTTGAGTLAYQWEFDGTAIAGATATQYTVTNAQLTNAGMYSVLVTNIYGTNLSAAAFLSVEGLLTNAPGSVVLPAGALNWWPADGNAIDILSGANGTPQGNLTYVPGVDGLAFNFNGATAVIPTGVTAVPGNWSACMWVNPQNSPQSAAGLLEDSTYALRLEQVGGTAVGISVSGVNYTFSPAYTAPVGTWTHLAFVGNSSGVTLYVNGAVQASLSTTMHLPRSYIGGGYNGTSYVDFMAGSLDDVMTFDAALNATQIASIYNAGGAGAVRAPQILGASQTASNQVTINVEGQTGKGYTVYTSTNLLNWTNAGTLANGQGTNQFIDSAATNSQKFYRFSQTY